MTTKDLSDIWARIDEQRANYQSIIDNAIENARELIKEARRGLDALPVAKVRRARKASEPVEPVDERSVFDVVRDMNSKSEDDE